VRAWTDTVSPESAALIKRARRVLEDAARIGQQVQDAVLRRRELSEHYQREVPRPPGPEEEAPPHK
jgi:hypothetical protein